jgi:hypothetical protein
MILWDTDGAQAVEASSDCGDMIAARGREDRDETNDGLQECAAEGEAAHVWMALTMMCRRRMTRSAKIITRNAGGCETSAWMGVVIHRTPPPRSGVMPSLAVEDTHEWSAYVGTIACFFPRG